MKNLLTYIRSINFAVLICLISMAGQAFHTFYTSYTVSSIQIIGFKISEASVFVVAFDCFTLFFLSRGKVPIAKFFSICLGIMNIFFYYDSMKGSLGVNFIVGVFISIIQPTAIYFVAEIVKQEYDAQLSKDSISESKQSEIDSRLETIEKELAEKRVGRKQKTIKIPNPKSLINR